MGLVPPWQLAGSIRDKRLADPVGYYLIFEGLDGLEIDFGRLILQWVLVALVLGGVWLIAKKENHI